MTDDGAFRRRKGAARDGKAEGRQRGKVERPVPVHEPDDMDVDGQLVSHNVWVAGHRTSIRLEAVMWRALHEIAVREGKTAHDLITIVSTRRHPSASLTATIRAFLVAYLRGLAMQRDMGPVDRVVWEGRGAACGTKPVL